MNNRSSAESLPPLLLAPEWRVDATAQKLDNEVPKDPWPQVDHHSTTTIVDPYTD